MFSELHDCKIPECHEMLTGVKVGHKSIDHERERERENNSDESFLCLTDVSPTPVLLIL